MKIRGPIITLAAGGAVAAILITMSVQASRATENAAQAGQPAQVVVEEPATPVEPDPASPVAPAQADPIESLPAQAPAPAPASPEEVKPPPTTYAGRVDGGGASVAVVVREGTAVAYVCDGKQLEAWMQGAATAGQLSLTSAKGSQLTGNYTGDQITGSLSAKGRQFTFTVSKVAPPSALYRATAAVRGATIDSTWIVLADGTQVGVSATEDGTATSAPPLNMGNLVATVDGATVTAGTVDGPEDF